MDRKSWLEFRESGLLWFINSILQAFGWAIVLYCDEDEDGSLNVVGVFPARVKFRGFLEKDNTEGYQKVSRYMLANAGELVIEAHEE